MIYCFGSYSGANFNPAVSLALTLSGKMKWEVMILYWTAQFLGGIVAAALVTYMLGRASGIGASVGSLTFSNPWAAFLLEGLLTFIVVLTVFIVSSKPWLVPMNGIILGSIVIFATLTFGPLTGGSTNPARSLGPAIFSDNLPTYWIYLFGPLLGGILGSLFIKLGPLGKVQHY